MVVSHSLHPSGPSLFITLILIVFNTLIAFMLCLAHIPLPITHSSLFAKGLFIYYVIQVGGMTHYDREEDLKDLDIMLKFKQEIHKKGEVFAWKYKNSTILL